MALRFSGIADVCEWFDEDERKFRIEVSVTNRTWGRLFGYQGRFDAAWKPIVPGAVPADLRPRREEPRE